MAPVTFAVRDGGIWPTRNFGRTQFWLVVASDGALVRSLMSRKAATKLAAQLNGKA